MKQAAKQNTLDTAPAGTVCCIKEFHPEIQELLRLMELGFKPGESVTVLQRAKLQGLLKVKIKETRFAICRRQACHIFVELSQAVAEPTAAPTLVRHATA